jgi:hypothetical protein
LKNQFHFITDEKYQDVMKELSGYEIYPNSANEHLPDHCQLAKKLNLPQIRINKILKDLINKIIEDFQEHPLVVKEVVHVLYISPYIEPEDRKEDWVQDECKRSIVIPVVLPVTPRIGEFVEIPFVRMSYSSNTEEKCRFGVVHDVRHSINGTTQEIEILVYPYKSIYYKWEKMKTDFENDKRRKARFNDDRKNY